VRNRTVTRWGTIALLAACTLLGALAGGASAATVMRCDGLTVRVPVGWYGRARGCHRGVSTVTIATFPLVRGDDDVDERSAQRMARRDVLVLVVGDGRDQAQDNPVFRTGRARVTLALDLRGMAVYRQFEGMPRGHRLARRLFVAAGAAYDVQVQFGGPISPPLTRVADDALRRLRFTPPS
jgi:hypothetical protein